MAPPSWIKDDIIQSTEQRRIFTRAPRPQEQPSSSSNNEEDLPESTRELTDGYSLTCSGVNCGPVIGVSVVGGLIFLLLIYLCCRKNEFVKRLLRRVPYFRRRRKDKNGNNNNKNDEKAKSNNPILRVFSPNATRDTNVERRPSSLFTLTPPWDRKTLYQNTSEFFRRYPPPQSPRHSFSTSELKELYRRGLGAWRFDFSPELAKWCAFDHRSGQTVWFLTNEAEISVVANLPIFDPITTDPIQLGIPEEDVHTVVVEVSTKTLTTVRTPSSGSAKKGIRPGRSHSTKSNASRRGGNIRNVSTKHGSMMQRIRKMRYFEVTILMNSTPKKTRISIGLCTKPYPYFR